jgi:enhancing lycopene biosynthesis protein 2
MVNHEINKSSYLYPYWAGRQVSLTKTVVEALTEPVPPVDTTKKLRKLCEKYGFDRITVSNLKGIIVATDNGKNIGVDISDRNYVKNTLVGEATQTALDARIDDNYYVVTATPVYITANNIIIGTVTVDKIIDSVMNQ